MSNEKEQARVDIMANGLSVYALAALVADISQEARNELKGWPPYFLPPLDSLSTEIQAEINAWLDELAEETIAKEAAHAG